MGGGIPSHIGMAWYSNSILNIFIKNYRNITKECFSRGFEKDNLSVHDNEMVFRLSYDELIYMANYVHFASMGMIFCRNFIFVHIFKGHDFFRQLLRILHIFTYMGGILLVIMKFF